MCYGAGNFGLSRGDITRREDLKEVGRGAQRTANQGAPIPASILGDQKKLSQGRALARVWGPTSQLQLHALTKVIWTQTTRETRGQPYGLLKWDKAT